MLLSRTADHLYWHARYIERAENTARMLGVNYDTLLMPHEPQNEINLWRATLGLSELEPQFLELYGEISTENVLRFMVTDQRNLSSIVSCLWSARENARAVRDSLTSEMWETVNDMWLESCQWVKSDRAITQVREYLDWIKLRSHLILGVALGTMLKDETFNFLRMGTFIESSEIRQKTQDATNAHDDTKDFYHWAALLRSVSGFEVYRQTYHDVITPARVAELLIFRKEMPRSLAACLIDLNKNIAHVRNAYSQKTERLAGKMLADLQYGQIEEVLQYGIHEYLTEFLEKAYALGHQISQDFLVPLNPAHSKSTSQ